jgi:hypothetical protein
MNLSKGKTLSSNPTSAQKTKKEKNSIKNFPFHLVQTYCNLISHLNIIVDKDDQSHICSCSLIQMQVIREQFIIA